MAETPVVLVTGAAGGIGSEIVRILLEELEASVVATDLVMGDLQTLEKKYAGRLHIELGNVVDPALSERCVQSAVQKFGKLTGVCLNAGVFGTTHRLETSSVDQWSRGLDINVLSHLHTLKYALPELRKNNGRVTATTSAAGYGALFSGWGFYGMSKAAVGFLIKQLAFEEPKITAVGISPGLCDTKMVGGLLKGEYGGWGPEDIAKYQTFVDGMELITPAVAGNAYAQAVTKADKSLSGLVVEYDDPRLPIADNLKHKEQ